jgi:endonuclease YncB( thermonuclease family)
MKFLLLLFILVSCTNNIEYINQCSNPFVDSVAIVVCVAIIDGDTWKFAIGEDLFGIRVLGIDCFETRKGSRLTKQANKSGISIDSALFLGKKAKEFANNLLFMKKITIIRDYNEDNMDVYGRLLRKVYINQMSYDSLLIINHLIFE